MTEEKKLTPMERLAFSTVRIETTLSDGGTGTGTGFFYKSREQDGTHIPVIVTNKHVIKGAVKGRFMLTPQNAEGLPDLRNHIPVEFEGFEQKWIHHPIDNVDLCVLPIGPLINAAQERLGHKLFYCTLDKSLLPIDEDYDSMFGADDILMIGYPNGIWDETNNLPVFRKGITATNPRYDWNNKKEFLIDCACFPGSSGSPVLLMNMGGYFTRTGLRLGSTRIKLLGILYAGPQHSATGEIEIVDVPVVQKPSIIFRIPNNLGIVIKAELLNDFDDVFDSYKE